MEARGTPNELPIGPFPETTWQYFHSTISLPLPQGCAGGGLCLGWSCVFSSHNSSPPVQQESVPSKCYLECFTLPNDDTTKLDLQQVATVAMAHLDRIAEPYLAFDKVQD